MRKRPVVLAVAIALVAALVLISVGASAAVKIKYTRWASVDEAKNFQALVDEFNETHPDVQVVAEFLPWGAYWQKLQTALISGDAADVVSMSNGMAAKYLARGVFYDMSSLAGAKERLSQMFGGARKAVTVDGKILGMPVGIGVRALVYNKDMFDEAGVPYLDPKKPLTWDEFVAIGKKLTKFKNGKPVQYAFNTDVGELHVVLVHQAGGSIVDDESAPRKVTVNSKEGIEGFRFMKQLYDEKILPPYKELGPWGERDTAIATGRVAIMLAGPWGLDAVVQKGIRFGTAPLFMGKERATWGYINFLSIPKTSKHPKEAWKFIEWLTSKEGQIKFSTTGDLPANMSALDEVKKKPAKYSAEIMAPFYEELPYIISGPMVPTDEFTANTDGFWRDMLDGKLTPEQAAAKIEQVGQPILDEINKKLRRR